MGLFDLSNKATAETPRQKQLKKAASLCIREEFDKALDIYEEILDEDPDCVEAYVGIVRARSEDYTKLDSPEIEKAIRIANKTLPDDFDDEDYLQFLKRRKRALTEAEETRTLDEKRREEAQRKAREEEEKARLLALTALYRFEKIGPYSVRLVDCVDKNLTDAIIPERDMYGNFVTEIGDHVFQSSKLRSVTIPGSVKIIGVYSFAFSDNLTTVTISEGVTSIEDYAFYVCKSLRNVTLPRSVKKLGFFVFRSCQNLTIKVPSGVNAHKEALLNCKQVIYY